MDNNKYYCSDKVMTMKKRMRMTTGTDTYEDKENHCCYEVMMMKMMRGRRGTTTTSRRDDDKDYCGDEVMMEKRRMTTRT